MGPKGDSRLSAHKAAAAVAEGGLAEGNLMEGVEEGQAQLGADGAGPEQVLCQLLSAEGATPGGRARESGSPFPAHPLGRGRPLVSIPTLCGKRSGFYFPNSRPALSGRNVTQGTDVISKFLATFFKK